MTPIILLERLAEFVEENISDIKLQVRVTNTKPGEEKERAAEVHKMRLKKKTDVISKPVSQCVDYIYDHINERITVQTLSGYTGLSVSYLSRVFKQNLGVSVSDYVREKKIEKAQALLRYSDASLIDIANYLAFSSQSHFIQVFEELVGITPKKYRDKYYKSIW